MTCGHALPPALEIPNHAPIRAENSSPESLGVHWCHRFNFLLSFYQCFGAPYFQPYWVGASCLLVGEGD